MANRVEDFRTYKKSETAYGLDPSFNNATIKVQVNCHVTHKELGYDTLAGVEPRQLKVLRNDLVFNYKADKSCANNYVYSWPKVGDHTNNGAVEATRLKYDFLGVSLLPEEDNLIPVAISGTVKLLNTTGDQININDRIVWDLPEEPDAGPPVVPNGKFVIRKLGGAGPAARGPVAAAGDYTDNRVLRRIIGFAISNAKKGQFFRMVILK